MASRQCKNEFVEVVCVVETRLLQGRTNLVTLPGGLRITPYHPVFIQVCGMGMIPRAARRSERKQTYYFKRVNGNSHAT